MSEIVKEKPIMEEAHKRYNNFIRSRLMMTEYEKKELYQYDKQITLKEEKQAGIKEWIKKGRLAEQISMATAMKKDGADINLISKYTRLSVEEVEKL